MAFIKKFSEWKLNESIDINEVKTTNNVKIGGLYLFDEKFWQDQANKTIGQPGVSGEIFQNRKRVTQKVTPDGEAIKQKTIQYFKDTYGIDVFLKWNIYCGCSMCPCSPGFDIVVTDVVPQKRSQEDLRFDVFVKDNDELDVREPKYKWWFNDIVDKKKGKIHESLSYYTNNEQAAKNAREMVGDGKTPNMFWVTVSNDYMIDTEEGIDYASSHGDESYKAAKTIGEYTDIKDALNAADEVILNENDGPRYLMIEDRQYGTVYERYLHKQIKTIWEEEVNDDTRRAGLLEGHNEPIKKK